MAEEAAKVLELRGITKVFPGTVANDHIDFDLRRGEVHALLGENGAGKTTLMNILYGLSKPDEGEIILNGERITFSSPKDAIERGIGMVHQHFMLIPVMTVAENIVLGVEPSDKGFLDYDAARVRVRELARRFGFQIDPDARIEDIGVGQQQRVEILKALYRNAGILILDEPTAVLTPQEATEFFGILETLKREGISIIFISHKLNEVLEIADRVTVLRRGKRIETVPIEGATQETLARAMVGREVLLRVEKAPAQPGGDVLLEIEDLHVLDDREIEKVRGVSMSVRAGEIVGIAGVDGNGQTELIDAITGLRRIEHGTVRVAGKDLGRASARDVLDSGVGHIPEDRQRRGLVLQFSIAENIALHDFRKPPNARLGWLYPQRLIEKARELIREFDVRGGRPETRAGALSGGTHQTVSLARAIDRDPKVLIAAQPTRGLDVGAIEVVHARLIAERNEGVGILLVSLELEEILSLSDRILVIFEGEVVGEYPPSVTEDELGIAMTGGRKEAAA
jgi:ABC-type uncharacterized transport system ATPase subunit